ncbi:hypothetical protein P5673_027095, partial [Acropora cervicornis]
MQTVIHVEPPRTETGQAGRDGKLAHAMLYYNNRDIAKNLEGMSDNIRNFCQLNEIYLKETSPGVRIDNPIGIQNTIPIDHYMCL